MTIYVSQIGATQFRGTDCAWMAASGHSGNPENRSNSADPQKVCHDELIRFARSIGIQCDRIPCFSGTPMLRLNPAQRLRAISKGARALTTTYFEHLRFRGAFGGQDLKANAQPKPDSLRLADAQAQELRLGF